MRKIFLAFLLSFLLVVGAYGSSQVTSSTTGSTLITQIRYILNDTDASAYFWSDTELIQWINEGMRDIAFKSHCLEDTEGITLASSTIEYSLSTSNYIGVKTVIYTDSDGNTIALKKGTPTRIGLTGQGHLTSSNRQPEFYYEWNGKLGIYPPLSSVTTQVATAYLIEFPSTITTSGSISTPAIFDNALRSFVISRAFYKDRQFQKAAQWEAKYESEINRYRQDFIEMPREVE